MKIKRALELLNAVIDSVVERNGLNAHHAFEELIDMGFTRNELIVDFGFTDEEKSE